MVTSGLGASCAQTCPPALSSSIRHGCLFQLVSLVYFYFGTLSEFWPRCLPRVFYACAAARSPATLPYYSHPGVPPAPLCPTGPTTRNPTFSRSLAPLPGHFISFPHLSGARSFVLALSLLSVLHPGNVYLGRALDKETAEQEEAPQQVSRQSQYIRADGVSQASVHAQRNQHLNPLFNDNSRRPRGFPLQEHKDR